ncbi:LuxR C-terminal-related transcriptional regulator [uncultured Erythrobacter sp.]|uniref:LuxR C-terminal-related transcriptional regulator n=1 Tax=uncultured Erythrobacter sp. TaxID=263913 RepID=UPI00261E6F7E|nr:LuxR C-terminal-related transcriptional regulator [uncultured Erythrobacter sp.]
MSKRNPGRPSHPDILTPGEWKVADGVRHGLNNRQIAQRQSISLNAVKYHVSNILTKLGMRSREDLQRWQGIDASSKLKVGQIMKANEHIGAIGQIARTVSDIEEARDWYQNVLGLEPLFDTGNLAFFACAGVRLMLSQGDAGPESIIYFKLDNLHAHFETLEKRGAKIVSAPHRIHTHEDGSEEWMGFIEDSDGRPIGLMCKTTAG